MIVLLDTSTAICKLEIIQGDDRQCYEWDAGRTLARGLLRFLDEKTGGLASIKAIGVMKGPGSFTGLRIGISVMNTLADSLGIPIVGETGEEWRGNALRRLSEADNEKVVLPLYGAAANITQPRK